MDYVTIFQSYLRPGEKIFLGNKQATIEEFVEFFLKEWLPFEGSETKTMEENIELFFNSYKAEEFTINLQSFVFAKAFQSLALEKYSETPETLVAISHEIYHIDIDFLPEDLIPEFICKKIFKLKTSEYISHDSYLLIDDHRDFVTRHSLTVQELKMFGYKGDVGFSTASKETLVSTGISEEHFRKSERGLFIYDSMNISFTPKQVSERVHKMTFHYLVNPAEILLK